MMGVLMTIYGITPTLQILLLPVWLLLAVLLAVGIGLYTSALMVSYRDVQYILPVATQFLLYASPVAYSLSYALTKIPEQYQVFYFLNPLAGLLDAFRWSLLGQGTLQLVPVLFSAGATIVIFISGAFAFKKMERKFADVI
jgi:lipopolysaccharide transport system permease protein